MMKTFHESFGTMPMVLLRTYKKFNVSPADHDTILSAFGFTWQDGEHMTDDEWTKVMDFVRLNIRDGVFRLPRYM